MPAPTVAEAAAPPLAVYERVLRASLARVWENVLDWEHLPWLHRSSFSSVELLEGRRDGWRAVIGLAGASRARTAEIDVEIDRARLRYVTATLAGAGEGTEIVTSLRPVAERTTRVRVEFRVPGIPPERSAVAGEAYRALYRRLWDEDESMMVRRQAFLDGALGALEPRPATARVSLGPVAELRRRLPLAVELGGAPFRVVDLDGVLVAHAAICPHRGGPLDAEPIEGCVVCPWHGCRYDVGSGRSASAAGVRLPPARVVVDPRTDEAFLEAAGVA